MPTIPLATLARGQGIRRKAIALRPIATTTAQATELAAIIMPIVNHWQQAQADILRGYVLPTNDGLTIDRANNIDGEMERAAGEATRLVLNITPKLRDWSIKVEKYLRGKWIGAVKTATNVDLSTVLTSLPVEDTLDAWLARNVALVRDISAQTQSRIADVVFRNYQQRTPIEQVAKEMREVVGMSRQRAIRVAGDQTKKIAAQLNRERRLEAGVEQYKYRHSGKAHPRVEHKARDGYVYDETGQSTNGGPFIPADDRAGSAPFCGCLEQAWLAIIDEID